MRPDYILGAEKVKEIIFDHAKEAADKHMGNHLGLKEKMLAAGEKVAAEYEENGLRNIMHWRRSELQIQKAVGCKIKWDWVELMTAPRFVSSMRELVDEIDHVEAEDGNENSALKNIRTKQLGPFLLHLLATSKEIIYGNITNKTEAGWTLEDRVANALIMMFYAADQFPWCTFRFQSAENVTNSNFLICWDLFLWMVTPENRPRWKAMLQLKKDYADWLLYNAFRNDHSGANLESDGGDEEEDNGSLQEVDDQDEQDDQDDQDNEAEGNSLPETDD